jgi:hypothetical protein
MCIDFQVGRDIVREKNLQTDSVLYVQVMAALAVSLAPFAAGLGKGYSSPAIASLQQLTLRRPFNSSSPYDISVSDQQASWVASLSLLGKHRMKT